MRMDMSTTSRATPRDEPTLGGDVVAPVVGDGGGGDPGGLEVGPLGGSVMVMASF